LQRELGPLPAGFPQKSPAGSPAAETLRPCSLGLLAVVRVIPAGSPQPVVLPNAWARSAGPSVASVPPRPGGRPMSAAGRCQTGGNPVPHPGVVRAPGPRPHPRGPLRHGPYNGRGSKRRPVVGFSSPAALGCFFLVVAWVRPVPRTLQPGFFSNRPLCPPVPTPRTGSLPAWARAQRGGVPPPRPPPRQPPARH